MRLKTTLTSLLACFDGVCDTLKGVCELEAVTFIGVCKDISWAGAPNDAESIVYESTTHSRCSPGVPLEHVKEDQHTES